MDRKSDTATSGAATPYRDIFNDFERLANHSQDAIYHFDIAGRRFLFFNQKFRDFFQLGDNPAVDTTPDHIFNVIHVEDRGHVLEAFDHSLKGLQTEGEAEYRVQKLIFDILYYAKERELEIEAVEVWQFAQEITIHMENRIKAADITFDTDFPHDSG